MKRGGGGQVGQEGRRSARRSEGYGEGEGRKKEERERGRKGGRVEKGGREVRRERS